MENLIKRKPIFVALFLTLMTLAGMNHFAPFADAAALTNGTLPPPGGTLPPNAAGIQLLHLAPFGSDAAVNATISAANGTATYSNINLGQSTSGYQPVTGVVNGSVTPAAGGTPLTFSATLDPDKEYTTAAIGGANGWPIEFLTLEDTTAAPAPLYGKVRIVHAAPFAAAPAINTAVNVVGQSGESINDSDDFEGIVYKQSTDYITLPVGYYDWKVTLPVSGATVVDLPPFTLYSEAIVTLYIMGDGTVQPAAGLYAINELGNEPTLLYFSALINS